MTTILSDGEPARSFRQAGVGQADRPGQSPGHPWVEVWVTLAVVAWFGLALAMLAQEWRGSAPTNDVCYRGPRLELAANARASAEDAMKTGKSIVRAPVSGGRRGGQVQAIA